MAKVMEGDGYDYPKLADQSSDDDRPDVPIYADGQQDWTAAEERKLVFKLDCIIMTILTLCFFCMQMDRGNIGNALTNNFLKDVGIDKANYNVGQQLLYVGIVILELPSNLVLYRVGPRLWLGGQVVIWGFIETFQSFQNNLGSFYATRLLLGMAEAGFIPAGLYCLSLWYKRSETSKRFTIFYFGNLVAQGATSLLAYGILRMEGIAGRHGWQWMFILEGIFTVLCGVLLILFLPKDPSNPYPLSRISYFTAREREIMVKRVLLDDPSKEKRTHHVTLQQIKKTFLTPRIYPHLLISMCGIASVSTWLQYAPTLVAGFGYSKLKANAMVSIGGWAQIPVSLFLGILADKTKKRGLALFIGIVCVWGFVIGDLIVHDYKSNTKKFALLIMTLSFSSVWQPINGSWLSINSSSPAERSITLAMFVSCTNIGGIFGSQLFQPDDAKGGYKTGWSAILGIETVALVSTIAANIIYRYLNRRNRAYSQAGAEFHKGERVKFWL